MPDDINLLLGGTRPEWPGQAIVPHADSACPICLQHVFVRCFAAAHERSETASMECILRSKGMHMEESQLSFSSSHAASQPGWKRLYTPADGAGGGWRWKFGGQFGIGIGYRVPTLGSLEDTNVSHWHRVRSVLFSTGPSQLPFQSIQSYHYHS